MSSYHRSHPNSQAYLDACKARVEEAKARLTLREVWDLAPHCGQSLCPANGLDVVRSPLREDRTPSFSIFAGAKAFDDKGREGVKGGVWEFVKFCRPEMDQREIARLLVERAGLAWPEWAAYAGGGAAGAAKEDDAARAKRLKEERLSRQRAEEAQLDQAERERRAERDGLARRMGMLAAWPECVRERWAEGARYRDRAGGVLAKLCAARGWPVTWADMLAAEDALAFPLETRWEGGEKGAKRMVAFRVSQPTQGAGPKLLDVGYHQKFFNVAEGRSGWRFLPSAKPPRRPAAEWSSYERALVEAARSLGAEEGTAMVPPLPFVVGRLVCPRLVVITEGQWDALTFAGAMGDLDIDGTGPGDVAYFGIRGVSGTRAFLDYWGGWLRAVKPLIWLLPDNDNEKTGARWFPPARAAERAAGAFYFSERLARMSGNRVVVSPLRQGAGGKDFNDYYKAAKPDRAAMTVWMQKLNLAA